MFASWRRTKWILGNVQNNYRNMTDYVNHQVESSTPSDQQQRKPDGEKIDDVAQKEGDGRLSEDAVDWVSENDMQYSFKYWRALSCIHRRTVKQSLNSTRFRTSSQWRSVCNGRNRPRSNFFILLTRWAEALSTRCSLSHTSAHQLVLCYSSWCETWWMHARVFCILGV